MIDTAERLPYRTQCGTLLGPSNQLGSISFFVAKVDDHELRLEEGAVETARERHRSRRERETRHVT